MPDEIVIRKLTAMPDLTATAELQKAVWGMHDIEAASPHTLKAIVHSGGAVFGAEAEGQLVGFCFGMAAWRARELWLWSHMAAVLPALQGRGIGFRLKQAQREWALAQGYRRMAWTFDPMQSGNANFNFNLLGVSARRYSVNHYGNMQDGINAGLASDRLEAQWQLDSPRVGALARGESPPAASGAQALSMLLAVDQDGNLRREEPAAFEEARYGIEIPVDFAALKAANIGRAQDWQLQMRAAMTALLEAGYVASGFQRAGEKAWYILSRET